jgi:hypothetical protein
LRRRRPDAEAGHDQGKSEEPQSGAHRMLLRKKWRLNPLLTQTD